MMLKKIYKSDSFIISKRLFLKKKSDESNELYEWLRFKSKK